MFKVKFLFRENGGHGRCNVAPWGFQDARYLGGDNSGIGDILWDEINITSSKKIVIFCNYAEKGLEFPGVEG